MDGRSWLPLLDHTQGSFPADRPLATELDLKKDSVAPGRAISCAYRGVRDERYLYVEHTSLPDRATGACEPSDDRELYDHDTDQFELNNLLAPGRPSDPVSDRLAALTAQLADCAGIEGRDPEPASGHYCR
jgi:hypothetical protein